MVSLRQLRVKVGRKQKGRRSLKERKKREEEKWRGRTKKDSESKLCEVHIGRRFKGEETRRWEARVGLHGWGGSSGRPPHLIQTLCVALRRTAGELRGRFVAQPKFPSYNPGIYLKDWL